MTEAEWILRMWRYIDQSTYSTLLVGKERRLWDNSRVDILTTVHAVEVDWVHKWKEAIGQALWYSAITNKIPGICLLCPDINNDMIHLHRCNTLCVKYGIALWIVDTEKNEAIVSTGERISI